MRLQSDNRTMAMLCILAGVGLASAQDAVVKYMSSGYPAYETLLFRCIGSVPVVAFLLLREGKGWSIATPHWARVMLRGMILAGAYLSFVLAIAATVLFIRHFVTRPVVDLAGIMDELTKDRTDIMVPMVGRGDELGRMARAVATFRDGISRRLDLERAAKAEAERREARIREIQSLCTDFDQTFVTTVASMMGIAGDLTQESQVMSEAA